MSINFSGGHVQQYGDVGSCGQTWSNVEPNRSNNTWYQNTTGRPIQLGVALLKDRWLQIGSSTSNYVQVVGTGSDPSEAMNGCFVPVNHYWRTNGKRTWSEFR